MHALNLRNIPRSLGRWRFTRFTFPRIGDYVSPSNQVRTMETQPARSGLYTFRSFEEAGSLGIQCARGINVRNTCRCRARTAFFSATAFLFSATINPFCNYRKSVRFNPDELTKALLSVVEAHRFCCLMVLQYLVPQYTYVPSRPTQNSCQSVACLPSNGSCFM